MLPASPSIAHGPAAIIATGASCRSNLLQLNAKVSKQEESTQENQLQQVPQDGKLPSLPADGEEMMTLPYTGIIGYEPRGLFYKPVDLYDPLKDTSDLPGEDGSPERIAAMQERMQRRIDALKASGQWDEDRFTQMGKNPLQRVPLLEVMREQAKVTQPFESVDEFALVLSLTLVTITSLGVYLFIIKSGLREVVDWWLNSDIFFDL